MLEFYMLPNLQQTLVAVLTIGLFISMAGLGKLAMGQTSNLPWAEPVVGWGVLAATLTLWGTLVHWPLYLPLFFVLGVGAYFAVKDMQKNPQIWLTRAKILAILSPMFIIIAGSSATLWDEFSTWLPSAQYLFRFDFLPHAGAPTPNSGLPAYPYAITIPTYVVSKLAGEFAETPVRLLNLMLLGNLVFALKALWELNKPTANLRLTWPVLGICALTLTLIWPHFVPKIIFSTYADFPLAIAIATATLSGLIWLQNVGRDSVRPCLVAMAFSMTLIVGLKEVGLIPAAIILGALCLLVVLYQRDKIHTSVKILVLITAPMLVIFIMWRWYIGDNIPQSGLAFKPLSQWHFDILPQMLARAAAIAWAKAGYVLVAFVVTLRAVYGLWKRDNSNLQQLSIIATLLFWGYNVFLWVAYLGAFSTFEAGNLASYWRYNIHVGLLVWLAFVALLGSLNFKYKILFNKIKTSVCWMALGVVILTPIFLAGHLRFEKQAGIGFIKTLASSMKPHLNGEAKIVVFEPRTNGKHAVQLRYELTGYAHMQGYISVFVPMKNPAEINKFLSEGKITHILVLNITQAELDWSNGLFKHNRAYFLEKNPAGGWRSLREWKYN